MKKLRILSALCAAAFCLILPLATACSHTESLRTGRENPVERPDLTPEPPHDSRPRPRPQPRYHAPNADGTEQTELPAHPFRPIRPAHPANPGNSDKIPSPAPHNPRGSYKKNPEDCPDGSCRSDSDSLEKEDHEGCPNDGDCSDSECENSSSDSETVRPRPMPRCRRR